MPDRLTYVSTDRSRFQIMDKGFYRMRPAIYAARMNDMEPRKAINPTQLLVLHGDVSADDFPEWIAHRARRLGLAGWIRQDSNSETVEILVSGPEELIDAMELGCSLGPMSVWVDRIDRRSVTSNDRRPVGFSIGAKT